MGEDYGSMQALRSWLERQGWAICDGTGGTPDLRNRMLLGTVEAATAGQRLGAWDHQHRVQGETQAPVRRNRNTPTGRQQLIQIPRRSTPPPAGHAIRQCRGADHLPPSMRVLFIMKIRYRLGVLGART
jgi:hypothetical protein